MRSATRAHSATIDGMRWGSLGWMVCLVTACTANPERAARSSVGCVRTVIEQRLPPQPNDKLSHCVAGALIAEYCSPTEARLAGVAKEMRDVLTGGDVESADVRATLAGVDCARTASGDIRGIEDCCGATLGRARAEHGREQ
jgi:hypothetical protein